MEIEESGIGFIFHNDRVVKFDDSEFYRRYFNCLPHSKGGDFVCEAGENGRSSKSRTASVTRRRISGGSAPTTRRGRS